MTKRMPTGSRIASMLVRKTLVLSTCFGLALLDVAGMADAAERTKPVRLTMGQMDKIKAGAVINFALLAESPTDRANPHPHRPGGKEMPCADGRISRPPLTTF
jgi:hypothetical protein